MLWPLLEAGSLPCKLTQGTEALGNLPVLGAWTIPSIEKTTLLSFCLEKRLPSFAFSYLGASDDTIEALRQDGSGHPGPGAAQVCPEGSLLLVFGRFWKG